MSLRAWNIINYILMIVKIVLIYLVSGTDIAASADADILMIRKGIYRTLL